MERTAVNPHGWTVGLGFDQAQLVTGHQRILMCSGQDAVDADGRPQHPGDLAAQLGMALDNLQTILAAADMDLTNVVRLNIYAADVDDVIEKFAILNDRFAGSRYATSIVGVASLPAGLLVMLEATAVD